MITITPLTKEKPKWLNKMLPSPPSVDIHIGDFNFGFRQSILNIISPRLWHYYLKLMTGEKTPKNLHAYVHNQELYRFLFEQADCDGESSYHCAAIILSYLKRMNDNKPLGKACCGKVPTVKDMKAVMEFCVKHKKAFRWY